MRFDADGEGAAAMRDIVERLELQAFVADKIQSGMKPLIMDCLDEITRLRAENEKLRREAAIRASGE